MQHFYILKESRTSLIYPDPDWRRGLALLSRFGRVWLCHINDK